MALIRTQEKQLQIMNRIKYPTDFHLSIVRSIQTYVCMWKSIMCVLVIRKYHTVVLTIYIKQSYTAYYPTGIQILSEVYETWNKRYINVRVSLETRFELCNRTLSDTSPRPRRFQDRIVTAKPPLMWHRQSIYFSQTECARLCASIFPRLSCSADWCYPV